MTREKVTAMRLAEALFPQSADRIVSYEQGGKKGVGYWYDWRSLDGKKGRSFRPVGKDPAGVAWGTSWTAVVAGLRAYSVWQRRCEAQEAGFIRAAFEAAAQGHDVREPSAQLFAWIHADPTVEGI